MFRQVGKIFMFGREPVRIDLLTAPSGIDFADCYERRKIVHWDGVPVPLIALEDLTANKTASGRAMDLADVENLASESRPKKRRRRRKR